jgi:hypothetical protein
MKMNFELKSKTSTEINERQAEVQLPLVWKMREDAKQPNSSSAPNRNN